MITTNKGLFFLGFIIRVMLMVSFVSPIASNFYIPFIELSINSPYQSPWEVWLSNEGDISAFPYGYMMYLSLYPFFKLFSLLAFENNYAYAYASAIFFFDIVLLILLSRLGQINNRKVLIFYWLSPLVIVLNYIYGFNDIIPVFFLLLSLYLLKENRFTLSGAMMALSISAKLSMLLALPFFLIYFINRRALGAYTSKFLIGLIVFLTIFVFSIFMLDNSALSMVLNNPETWKTLDLTILLGDNQKIYLIPMIYFLSLYMFWRIKHLNFHLFISVIGVMFFSIALMTPNASGWFIWAIPFLVFHQLQANKSTPFLVFIFSTVYIFWIIFFNKTNSIQEWITFIPNIFRGNDFEFLFTTFYFAIGVILFYKIWRESITNNDFYQLSSRPFSLGIAGYESQINTKLVNSINNLFGLHSVRNINQNKYSLWGVDKPVRKIMSKYNPMTYELSTMVSDFLKCRTNRKFNYPKIITLSGFHSLYLPVLRKSIDLTIYFDVNEEISQKIFHTNLDKKDKGDIEKFIHPQNYFADLFFSINQTRSVSDKETFEEIKTKLTVKSRHGFDEEILTKVLVGVCGLYINKTMNDSASEIELIIEGDVYFEDIEMAAKKLFPRLIDFLDLYPKWLNGVEGVIQLIVLSHIEQSLSQKLL